MGRKKKRGARGSLKPSPGCNGETVAGGALGVTGYELLRQQSIRDNMLRMQRLGILDLSLNLASHFLPPKRPRRNPPHHKLSLPSPSQPLRRSSRNVLKLCLRVEEYHHKLWLFLFRLKSMSPVSYSELRPKTKSQFSMALLNNESHTRKGSKPEVYSEEHEELLGDCKTSWTLFVDGYNKEGKRIYDQVKGKTCHQCRQKTLGYRTHCSKCKLIQGQFCGDCLYMRYGENVIEANKNPSWICPVCRGICNCSLCRQAKGWMPTGPMYKKVDAIKPVSELGFKSVAHYLIQTRRAKTSSEDPDAEILVSAKTPQSMADTGAHALQIISLDADTEADGCPKSQHDNNDDNKYEAIQEVAGTEVHHLDANGAYVKDDGNEDESSDA
ncbi:Cell division cycle-associated 7-like protein [Vitis vinifera]|uniref:Cell division cycle-associated 7-like protein n=1 Tax=Vitis vinifera TaxID=29760 RepID=A0A438FMY5_VITVI|nr:Cell division cycle-associated 7-like protein [Vitis vinifera]